MTASSDEKTVIHFNELINFLAARRPDQKCSVCGQDEGWKFHAEAKSKEENPKMTIFEIPVQGDPSVKSWIDSVCIECPKCATMNFLGANAVAAFTAERAKGNG
ncbi:hypothetical protein LOY33_13120 [Pseudomonas sp. B21-036]|uniref:hypothetical protein n=1 Tax=unclassified Pseudomonas TaxID=196821 RepID=UPI00215E4F4C|nr:hypothetical protein [Pseudomonas sp. B21-036]UVL48942.1 hypothetical protein LOY33_13120 [Pseudomonas sp. B21-036]